MQKDGNLVVYDKQHHPRWATNTYGKPGARLYLQTDGNLVVYQGKTALRHSHTGEVPRELRAGETLHVGEQRFSPDGKHRLILQGDGNLVLYGPGGAVRWASYTQGTGNYAVMQGDGNFVVYSAKGVRFSIFGGGEQMLALDVHDVGLILRRHVVLAVGEEGEGEGFLLGRLVGAALDEREVGGFPALPGVRAALGGGCPDPDLLALDDKWFVRGGR